MGQNALLCALNLRKFAVAQLLVSRGFDLKYCDKLGRNGLHYAACAGNIDFITKALESHIDVNCSDNNGWSPLHWAAASSLGTAKAINFLLNAGADRLQQDKQGKTPFDYAYGFGKATEAAMLRIKESIEDLLYNTFDSAVRESAWGILSCDACSDVRYTFLSPPNLIQCRNY